MSGFTPCCPDISPNVRFHLVRTSAQEAKCPVSHGVVRAKAQLSGFTPCAQTRSKMSGFTPCVRTRAQMSGFTPGCPGISPNVRFHTLCRDKSPNVRLHTLCPGKSPNVRFHTLCPDKSPNVRFHTWLSGHKSGVSGNPRDFELGSFGEDDGFFFRKCSATEASARRPRSFQP
jgi:hypothetical protein